MESPSGRSKANTRNIIELNLGKLSLAKAKCLLTLLSQKSVTNMWNSELGIWSLEFLVYLNSAINPLSDYDQYFNTEGIKLSFFFFVIWTLLKIWVEKAHCSYVLCVTSFVCKHLCSFDSCSHYARWVSGYLLYLLTDSRSFKLKAWLFINKF